MPSFTSKFGPSDRVIIDGQKDIIGAVSEVAFRSTSTGFYPIYTVEWLHNGTNQSVYVAEWRMKLAE